jgi:cell division protein ZapA
MSTHTPSTLDIQLLGKVYKVACPPDEQQALLDAAGLLNTRLDEVAAKGRFSDERLLAMVALNLAHDLLKQSEPSKSSAHSSNASPRATTALDSDEYARRIKAIETRIDAVLAG